MRHERIYDYICTMLVKEITPVYERYCEKTNTAYIDVMEMNDFDYEFEVYTPLQVADIVSKSDGFSPRDKYFWRDDDGVLYSFSYVFGYCNPYNIAAIAEYCDEYGDDLGDPHIRSILDQEEE